jgi:SAM-dependent methyltransferase
MNLKEMATCLVCGQVVDVPPDDPDSRFRRCGSCGFCWTLAAGSHVRRPEVLDTDEAARGYLAQSARWRYEATRRLRWLWATTRPAALLEAGSAGGFFLEAAARAGIRASGVELSEPLVRYARDELGAKVRHGLFEAGAPPDPVQAVCAFHVLERVDDPAEFLAAARRALAPRGWLALEVSNTGQVGLHRRDLPLIAGLAPASPPVPTPRPASATDRWHFSPRLLSRLVEAHGFVVRRADTVFDRAYLRPRERYAPRGLRAFVADWTRTGTPRASHSRLGDRVRLLAQVKKGKGS